MRIIRFHTSSFACRTIHFTWLHLWCLLLCCGAVPAARGAVTGSLATARQQHTATLLSNGKVLAAGGYNAGQLASAELYDPATGLWTAAGSLGTARYIHTAALLPDGKVYVAGGYNGGNLASAELYDPATNLWNSAAPLNTARLFHTATSLANGKVLIAGGSNGGILASAELNDSGVAPAGIAVEQPVNTPVASGGSRSLGAATVGTPASLTFTIKNPGGLNLTGLAITRDGSNVTDFTVTTAAAAPVLPGGSTTFTIQFAPAASGAKSAALHIANNVPGSNPYNLNLTGQALSSTTDTDGDGLNDASELDMAALGFNWQDGSAAQTALVNVYKAGANGAGYYTAAQIQALNIGAHFLQRNPATGQFKLELGMEKSADLSTYAPFPFIGPQTTVRPDGKIEFLFTLPDNTAFLRLQPQ